MVRLIALGLLGMLLACDAIDQPEWRVRFEDPELGQEGRLRAQIRQGGCDGTPVYDETYEITGAPELGPPLLDSGRYGFLVEWVDVSCRVRARGCEEVDLPREDGFTVTLASGPDTALCPIGACEAGVCSAQATAHIATARAHSCAADFAGRLYCWGFNNVGQVGNGMPDEASPTLVPTLIDENEAIRDVYASGGFGSGWEAHSCALIGDQPHCWGHNSEGQLGDGTQIDRSRPTPVPIDGVVDLALGARHSCAVRSGGELWCWGNNDFGQLGSEGGDALEPRRATFVDGAVQAAAGEDFTCVRRISGTVSCVGHNDQGQLGTTPSERGENRVRLPVVTEIDAGQKHVCAIDEGGSVYCWGDNDFLQTGDPSAPRVSDPRQMEMISGAIELGLGSNVTCVLSDDGGVRCWGLDSHGQRGLGEVPSPSVRDAMPNLVAGLEDVIRISYGSDHGCAIQSGGGMYCWGRNQHGRLGDGTEIDRGVAVQVLPQPRP